MSAPAPESEERPQPNAPGWAQRVSRLQVKEVPPGADNLNVEGRQVVGPLQGFGQLWQKTYRLRLSGVGLSPDEVVRYWKETLTELMPADSRFYPSLSGVKPGEVVLINAHLPGMPGGMPVSTGVVVLYADELSFTVMTPEGHPESGFNTFSAFQEEGETVAQIQSLARANDPLFEFGFRYLGGASQQEKIWRHVLGELGARLGARGQVEMAKTLVDGRVQWSQAGNIWHNSVIRTILHAPARWARKLAGRENR